MEDTLKQQIEKSNERLAKIIYDNREKILSNNAQFIRYDSEKIKTQQEYLKQRSTIEKIFNIGTIKAESKIDKFLNEGLGATLKSAYGNISYLASDNAAPFKKFFIKPKLNNRVNQIIAPKSSKLVEKGIENIGKISNRNFNTLASRGKQLTNLKIKKTLLGKIPNKSADKFSLTQNLFKEELLNFMPKKIGGVIKKVGSSKIGSNLMKSFSLGNMMNLHTIRNEDSDFKKLLAGADIVGDHISRLPGPIAKAVGVVTSTANFAGGFAYDFLKDKSWGKPITDALDKGAGYVVKPVGKAIKTVGKFMKPLEDKISNTFIKAKDKLFGSVKNKVNAIKKNPVKEAVKLGAGILSPGGYGAFKLAGKIKNTFKKLNHNDLNDIYYRNFALSKDRQSQMQHNGEVVQNKLQGSQIDNSNKNNFTINITGINKSTQEIMNEIVPEIKLRMKNISIA